MSNRMVKVVEHGNESKGFVDVCVPPNGRVRLAGSAYDGTLTGSYSIKIVAIAGTWVALDIRNTIDFHGGEEIEKVFDAKSGRSYRFFEEGIPEGPGFEGIPATSPSVERLALNRFGQLALALSMGSTTEIVAIEPSGAHRTLASGPVSQLLPASLKLEGHTVQWVDAGITHSATI